MKNDDYALTNQIAAALDGKTPEAENDAIIAMAGDSPPFAGVSTRELSINDHSVVYDAVRDISHRWDEFAQALRLKQNRINIIDKNYPRDCERCMGKALDHWLRKDYSYVTHGAPSWRMVCVAVQGIDPQLANEIARERPLSVAGAQCYVISHSPETGRNYELLKKLYDLQLYFSRVLNKTMECFKEMKQLRLSDIIDFLLRHMIALLGPQRGNKRDIKIAVQQEFRSIRTISALFDILESKYLSWFNYKLIIELINKFLSKNYTLRDTWLLYEKKLKDHFMESGTVSIRDAINVQFGGFNSPAAGTRIMIVKVACEDYTFDDLFLLREALPRELNIPEFELYFSYVDTGSLVLEYWIPDFLYLFLFPLSEEENLASIGINELSCGEYTYNAFQYMTGAKEELNPLGNSEYETGKSKTTDPTVNTITFKSKANDLLATVKFELTGDDMKNIILNEMVPCNFFLTTLQGLPYSGKSKLIPNFLKSTLNNGVHTLSAFKNNQSCLSMHSIALLRQRPFDDYFWFPLTELEAMWCSSAVFRKAILCKYDIKISLNNAPNRIFNEEVLDIHLNDVYQNIKNITKSKSKAEFQQLLSLGAIHMNILDHGSDTNKGVKEFLTLISQHLNYNLGIICLSMDDIKELNGRTLTFQESKISCIMRQAVEICSESPKVPIKFIIICSEVDTKGRRDKAERILLEAITKETARLSHQPLQVSVLALDPSLPDDMKKLNIALNMELPYSKKHIKLSWLFLRDALNNKKDIVISYDKLKDVADKLDIQEMELKEFLQTFTKFMSILYLPGIKSLQNVVILRPVEFINTMSSLFNVPDDRDFNGVYNMEQLNKMIPNRGLLLDTVTKALCSVGLAIKTTCDKVDTRISELRNPKAPLLFIPLARSGKILEKSYSTSLFIVFNSKLIQPDCQSFFISELLTLKGSSLLSGSDYDYHPNVFKILLVILRQEYIFSIIFRGTSIDAIMEDYGDSNDVFKTTILCCQKALSKISSIRKNFSYKLALSCLTPRPTTFIVADDCIDPGKRVFHELLPNTKLCYCCKASDSPLRKKWKEVIEKIYDNEEKRKKRVNVEKLIELAQSLGPVIKSTQTLRNLAAQLRVRVEQEYIVVLSKSCLPWQQVLMILLMWEKKEEATKESLKSALIRLGYPSVVLD